MTIEDAVTQPDDQSRITLVVRNNSLNPVNLEGGEVLGNLRPVTVEPTPVDTSREAHPLSEGRVGRLRLENPTSGRDQQLLDSLDWEAPTLSEEKLQLKSMLPEYADVFVLDPTELGSTDRVLHTVDTGDHLGGSRSQFVRKLMAWCLTCFVKVSISRRKVRTWASPLVLVTKKDG